MKSKAELEGYLEKCKQVIKATLKIASDSRNDEDKLKACQEMITSILIQIRFCEWVLEIEQNEVFKLPKSF